jgi:hypothetical protein
VPIPELGSLCGACAAVVGTADDVATLVGLAVAGDRQALHHLAEVSVSEARPLLEALVVEVGDEQVVDAATYGLAWIADRASWATVVGDLRHREHTRAALTYLGRVGGDDARSVLNGLLDIPDLAAEAAVTLAAIGAPGVEGPLLDAMRAAPLSGEMHSYDRAATWPGSPPLVALARLRLDSSVEPIVDHLTRLTSTPGRRQALVEQRLAERLCDLVEAKARGFSVHSDENKIRQIVEHQVDTALRQEVDNVAFALNTIDTPAAWHALEALGREHRPIRAASTSRRRPQPSAGTDGPRALGFAYQPGPIDHAGTRFGGQPTWLDRPTWPVCGDGTPMVFWGQIELIDDPNSLAYVFLRPDSADIFNDQPQMFRQAGGIPTGPWEERATGPQLAFHEDEQVFGRRMHRVFHALVPDLVAFHDSGGPLLDDQGRETDDHYIWNKIGGQVCWLQNDETPSGGRFTFQFTADAAGRELADGAECYGFLDPSGRGWFLWQSH